MTIAMSLVASNVMTVLLRRFRWAGVLHAVEIRGHKSCVPFLELGGRIHFLYPIWLAQFTSFAVERLRSPFLADGLGWTLP